MMGEKGTFGAWARSEIEREEFEQKKRDLSR